MNQERRWRAGVLVFGVLLVGVLPAAGQSVTVVAPTAFEATGPVIAGWSWCRAEEHLLDWEWGPVDGGSVDAAAVNFALLVTNRTSGGSGYGAVVHLTVYDVGGEAIECGILYLVNPFLPQVATDTGGIGYHAYGAYQFQKPDLILEGFRVRITWPPACPGTYHVAGKAESAFLVHVR